MWILFFGVFTIQNVAVKKKNHVITIWSHMRESTRAFTRVSHCKTCWLHESYFAQTVQKGSFLPQALQDKHRDVKAVILVVSTLVHAPTWVHDIFLLCVIVRFFYLFAIGDLESDHIISHVSQSANTANKKRSAGRSWMSSLIGCNQQPRAS